MNAAAQAVQHSARAAGNAVGRQIRLEAQKMWTHVQLRDLPRSTTPADVRRMLQVNQIPSVLHIHLDLHRFLPTGRAYLTLTGEGLTEPTVKALRGATIASQPITAVPSPPPEVNKGRGAAGFAAAADRGAIRGNGPSGNISGGGKNVVIYGVPSQVTHQEMREHLRGFQLAPEDRGQRVVVQVDTDQGQGYAVTSRHLVKMGSESEAYRLVRQWHMMPFRPQQFKDRFLIRAEIVH